MWIAHWATNGEYMIKKNLMLIIFLFLCSHLYCLSPEDEYDFLLKDLYNYSTYGYKRTYDFDADKSFGIINFDQGSIQLTNNNLDIAIMGNGFFKVKDDKGNEYYTRYGILKYDFETRSLCINVKNVTYFLDVKPLPEYNNLSIDKIRIRRDGSVECVIIEDKESVKEDKKISLSEKFESKNGLNGKIIRDEKYSEILTDKIEKKEEKKETIDKIILYNIVETNIDSYDGYLLKTKVSPDTIDASEILEGALEMSNVGIDNVLIRMLFIIEKLDDSKIKQKEVKKYLIKKMLDPDFVRVKLFGYFYEENPIMKDISGLMDYIHFLEREYE